MTLSFDRARQVIANPRARFFGAATLCEMDVVAICSTPFVAISAFSLDLVGFGVYSFSAEVEGVQPGRDPLEWLKHFRKTSGTLLPMALLRLAGAALHGD